jgi:hypothetical protein
VQQWYIERNVKKTNARALRIAHPDAAYTDDMSDEEYITDEDDVPYSDEGAFLASDSI